MRNKIIFLEGLPGSGKTVFTRRLKDDLKTSKTIKQFDEGEINPIDLGYLAVMTLEQYNVILSDFSELSETIKSFSMKLGEWMVIAFTKVPRPRLDDPFYVTLSEYQLMEYADYDTFKKVYLSLWKSFSKAYEGDTLYLYGGAFLQNHYEVLLLKYGLNSEEMHSYFCELIDTIRQINPLVVYIVQNDVSRTINRVAEKRKADTDGAFKDWFDRVIESLVAMPLSESKGYIGSEGAYRFYKDEQSFELDMLHHLDVEKLVVELYDDYDLVYEEILKRIKQGVSN